MFKNRSPFHVKSLVWLCVAFSLVALQASAQNEVQITTLTETLDGGVGGVAVDALSFIYVADFGERVWKISPHGEVSVFADSLYGSSGNAIDSRGNLLQANFNADSISKIARDGSVTTYAEGLNGPVGIALDKSDTAYVCNCKGNSISRVSTAGEVSDFAVSGLLNCPNGIVSSGQELYVVNFSDARMLRIDEAGEVTPFAVIPGGGNGHVAKVGTEFFVTGFRSNRLYRVSAAGEVSPVAGDGSFTVLDGPASEAKFASPNGIAYDAARDVLYTNDYLTPFSQRRQARRTSTIRRIAFPTLSQRFTSILQADGLKAAIDDYHAYKASRPGTFTEIEVNFLGYGLLQAGQTDAAVKVFELNSQSYPKSFNAWDSLAEGYLTQGKKSLAIEHYRKSLQLNPANANATKQLEALGAAQK